jgi:hypothetical protein
VGETARDVATRLGHKNVSQLIPTNSLPRVGHVLITCRLHSYHVPNIQSILWFFSNIFHIFHWWFLYIFPQPIRRQRPKSADVSHLDDSSTSHATRPTSMLFVPMPIPGNPVPKVRRHCLSYFTFTGTNRENCQRKAYIQIVLKTLVFKVLIKYNRK